MSGPSLQRIVGVRALALMIATLTVGAGIFGMPAIAAHDLGAAAILAYIAFHPFQIGFVVLEVTWAIMSVYAMTRRTARQ